MLLSVVANFGNMDFTTREGSDLPHRTKDICQNMHKALVKITRRHLQTNAFNSIVFKQDF